MMRTNLSNFQGAVDRAIETMRDADILNRIREVDHTVWRDSEDEIVNRLGWVNIADHMLTEVDGLKEFANAVRADGYDYTLLLGMGGSSLAPEVFSLTFGQADGYLALDILDTTDADAVRYIADQIDYSKTLFIVATKSGGTAETLSAFKYFYNRTADALGDANAGAHFVGITDPGSKLVTLGETYNFRKVFINDPNIGGRYSVLSFFGLVPAALLGIDLAQLLQSAIAEAQTDNALMLGGILGELAKAGCDKLTFITSDAIAPFGDWVEQLIAESTGKDSKGILPVVGENLGAPDVYGDDRLFVAIQLGDDQLDLSTIKSAGHPTVYLTMDSLYAMGAQFWLWEMATAIAGHVLGIHPFDQPNVESAKIIARQMIAAYAENGELPAQEAKITDGDIVVYGDAVGGSAAEALANFIEQASDGNYVALQAYVTPDDETWALLHRIRMHIRNGKHIATTSAYGPRFLHSTGQLHKGDAGNGLFIQITSDAVNDVDIPDVAGEDASAMTFGVLKLAQALGDQQALVDANRRVIRFHLGTDVHGGLAKLLGAFT
jgi:glucose-6-phosphate isomerase